MQGSFDPKVEKVLISAGWYRHREIAEKELAQLDAIRPLFPAARQALQEFNKLYFREIVPQSFCIDAKAAFSMFDSNEDLDEYEEDFGSKIYPIGIQGYQFMPLTLGSSQSYVTGSDNLIIDERGRIFLVRYIDVLVGDTIEQAIHNLITNTGFREWDSERHVPIR